MPCTHVGPTKIALHDKNIVTVLKDSIVDRQVRIKRVTLSHILHLLLIGIVGVLHLKITQYLWELHLEIIAQMLSIRDEDARVPIELTTLHKHLRKVTFRLLSERLHPIHIQFTALVAQLDVTIAWLWSRGLHAHDQQNIIL